MASITYSHPVFHLSNGHISYCLGILEGGIVTHLYFGRQLHAFHPESILRRHRLQGDFSFSPNNCALTQTPQEYPSFGLGDLRDGALTMGASDGTQSCDLRYVSHEIVDGKYALEGLPAGFGEKATTLKLHLRDALLGLEVTLLYAIYDDCDIVSRAAVLHNAGSQVLTVQKAMSLCLELPDSDYDLISLSGDWGRERQVVRRPLAPGFQGVQSLRGASSHEASPFLALARRETNEQSGEAIGAALVYSGSFSASANVDMHGNTRLLMGLNERQFAWRLQSGESLTLPEGVLAYSDKGLNGMSHQFHTLCAQHIVRGKYAHAPRPILLNNWEATYFDFNTDKLLTIARKAADVGMELFVLDDGWFGHRNDDHSSLGDWKINEEKLPGGLNRVAQEVHALGMRFGLWFEPEMVSPDSDLYRAHPEWAMHIQGRVPVEQRHQLILDLTREDVCDYVYHAVADILSENAIDYVKWDMNRNFSNIGSAILAPERMQEFSHRYILGLYSVLDRLCRAFPDVLFESCASGGGRFDLGMLYYMPQTWTSDNTDAVSRLSIQYGTSFVFPPFAMGAHISAVPNHQTGRITPLLTRANVALSGCFGFELDLNLLSEAEIEAVKKVISEVKVLRSTLLYGRFYRLLSPFDGGDTAWTTVSDDLQEAIVMLARPLALPNTDPKLLRLQGLDASRTYRVEETGECYGGDELMYSGITIPLPSGDAASVRLTLHAL
ncbi:MAG: alpha-galactosidase [Clostridia bacterium]|nr:alpha-galactosidase [Clostridia bacterium]